MTYEILDETGRPMAVPKGLGEANLSPSSLGLLWFLLTLPGGIKPTQEQILQHGGGSADTLRRHLAEIKAAGWIDYEEGFRGRVKQLRLRVPSSEGNA